MKSEYEMVMGEFEGVRRGEFGRAPLNRRDGTDDAGGEGQRKLSSVCWFPCGQSSSGNVHGGTREGDIVDQSDRVLPGLPKLEE